MILTPSVSNKSRTFSTALCSIGDEIIVLTPKSLTQDLKIELLDSLPPEVKTISFSFALIKEAIDFLAFSSKDLLSLEDYDSNRETIKSEVIESKKHRSITIGSNIVLLFENYETIRYHNPYI